MRTKRLKLTALILACVLSNAAGRYGDATTGSAAG